MTAQRVALVPAPTGIQPGNYVAAAYADAVPPPLELWLSAAATAGRWRIELRWAAPQPVVAVAGEPDRFVDAAALMVPLDAAANWMTMGGPQAPVEGCLWRPDRTRPWAIAARGLGTVERREAPADWHVEGRHAAGIWSVAFDLAWPALDAIGQAAVAIWRGANRERAGLKHVTPGWLDLRT